MSEALPDDQSSCKGTRDWPHAPPHRLAQAGVYYVTARTLDRGHHFHGPERLTLVRDLLLAMAGKYEWRLEAWAVLANHYHFVAHSPAGEATAESLGKLLKNLHADVSRFINRMDGVRGRQVLHNYRDR